MHRWTGLSGPSLFDDLIFKRVFMKIEVFHLLMPFLGQKGQDALVEEFLFDLFDRVLQAFDRSFYRGDNIPGEHLRKVMEQGGKIVVVEPLSAGRDLQGEEVREDGHDEHVAQDRGLWNSLGLGPSLLKAKLAAEVDKSLRLFDKGRSVELR